MSMSISFKIKSIVTAAASRLTASPDLVVATLDDYNLLVGTLKNMGAKIRDLTAKNMKKKAGMQGMGFVATLPEDHELRLYDDSRAVTTVSPAVHSSFKKMGYKQGSLGPQSGTGNGGMFLYSKYTKGTTEVIITGTQGKDDMQVLVVVFYVPEV